MPYPVISSNVLDITTKGYVNMSVKPEARSGLTLLALDLSKDLGRRVSLSEALEMALAALYANEVDVAKLANKGGA